MASEKGAKYSVLPTFDKNTEVLGPLQPRPRAGLPGGQGRLERVGALQRGAATSQRAWEEQWDGWGFHGEWDLI